MKREVSLAEISDGRLYRLNDLVRADCHDCGGCSACCCGMGDSIRLDPLDAHRLCANIHATFEGLLTERIDLSVEEGVIFPNLRMTGPSKRCSFLDEKGRCSVHTYRPGICRLFPLGRFYENHSFLYFLQVHECRSENRTKVKVRRWIDTPNLKKYEQFVVDWHYFLEELKERAATAEKTEYIKRINLYLLQNFYMDGWTFAPDSDGFYGEFAVRLEKAKEFLKEIG